MTVKYSKSGIKKVLMLYEEVDVDGVPHIRETNSETGETVTWPKQPVDEIYLVGEHWRYFPVIRRLKRRRRRKSSSSRTVTPLKITRKNFRRVEIRLRCDYEPEIRWVGGALITLPNKRKVFNQLKKRFPQLSNNEIKVLVRKRMKKQIKRELYKIYCMKDPRGETLETIDEITFNLEEIL